MHLVVVHADRQRRLRDPQVVDDHAVLVHRILHAYAKWGEDCVNHLRGMFAFLLWDEARQTLFCARDRFGIKPFYYAVVDGVFYFASEAKALVPFLPEITTSRPALA